MNDSTISDPRVKRLPAPLRDVLIHFARIALGALALAFPILLNSRPFPFTDTATYFQSGYYTLQWIFTDKYVPVSDFSRSYLGARSPFYGLPLTVLEAIGTFWLVVALQALAAAQIVDLLARAIGAARARMIYVVMILALTLASALPLFVGFMMPDLFAGFAIAAIALLVFYRDGMARWERVFLWIVLAAGLMFHMTHVLLAVLIMPAALALHHFMRLPGWASRARVLAAAFAVGIAAWVTCAVGNSLLPKPFYSPPFMTARILADGPGRVYLRHACAKDPNAYVICPAATFPLNKSDDILWSWKKDRGVFAVAGHPKRLAIIAEQQRFVINSILYDPLAQIGASLKAFVLQLGAVGVDEGFKLDAHFWMTYPPDFYLKTMAIRLNLCPKPLVKCPARLPLEEISVWHMITTGAAALYLLGWGAWAFVQQRKSADTERDLFLVFAGFVVFAVIANAAVCGILSGPFDRYQARVAWLLMALAILAEARFPLAVPFIRGRLAGRSRRSP